MSVSTKSLKGTFKIFNYKETENTKLMKVFYLTREISK